RAQIEEAGPVPFLGQSKKLGVGLGAGPSREIVGVDGLHSCPPAQFARLSKFRPATRRDSSGLPRTAATQPHSRAARPRGGDFALTPLEGGGVAFKGAAAWAGLLAGTAYVSLVVPPG